ncbi:MULTISPECIES: hypothetical protein [Burkholderia]|uniref:hypothetical protein n=1 Tax=Burkholderia TaxID=32008 RepID=UPI00064F60D7|nr:MULTISPECIES: hypothetical protein [Burkholderia]KML14830.1 hypothetical protein VL00_16590 [Burkholderia cepacia]KML37772.1 hypothetical protein VL13_24335 [Burkholderia lata]KMN52842.1 hypothetical protein VK92_31175 [Burkholderia sp. LK4]
MEIEDALDKGEYVLCGAMPVDADMELEHLESVRRHLGGIADIYFVRDDATNTVAIRVSGSISRDDAKVIDRRIQKFAHDHCSAGAILWRGWNNSWKWCVVGLAWQAQCLLKLAAAEAQFERLEERGFDFIFWVHLGAALDSGHNQRGNPVGRLSIEAERLE